MKYLFFIFIFFSISGLGQIAHYNQFPTMQHMRNDSILDSISFAYSMRQLYEDYQGPIIRLRRASDNAEMDFCKGTITDRVNIDSINTWRNGSNVFVSIWYDQSPLCRNAIQPIVAFQPRFIPDSARPYFFGDGINDKMDVLTDIKTLTNNGANGTVFSVYFATNRNQTSWGSSSGGERWFAHLNWGNGQAYFDPGQCCNTPRSFVNPGNTWSTLTCIRTTSNVIMRRNNIQQMNGAYTLNDFTNNATFGILHTGAGTSHSTNRFTELIMYKFDISVTKISNIELDQISFWNL